MHICVFTDNFTNNLLIIKITRTNFENWSITNNLQQIVDKKKYPPVCKFESYSSDPSVACKNPLYRCMPNAISQILGFLCNQSLTYNYSYLFSTYTTQ